MAVYYACAEALSNAAKHAAASRVTMRVVIRCDVVSLVVADDGIGGADPAAGSGLQGLADRVEALGGSLLVDSLGGGGTRMRATIPLA